MVLLPVWHALGSTTAGVTPSRSVRCHVTGRGKTGLFMTRVIVMQAANAARRRARSWADHGYDPHTRPK